MPYILEVCADSVQSAIEAQKGGADRIELCSGLVIGGLSPSACTYRQVKHYTDIKVRVLLRPRFGDFCYDEYEFQTIKEEVQMFRELRADGVVIGVLKPDGTLNMEQMEELKQAAGDMEVTLHRAFDVCRDPYEALEQCAALGIDTILTSGQRSSAQEGRDLLRELSDRSQGRVEIMAGAGITPELIEGLYYDAHVTAFHMSAKTVKDSRMKFRREGVPMGIPGFGEFEVWQTDGKQVERASEILKKLPQG